VKATAEARDHSKGKLLVKGPGLVAPEKDVKPPSRPRGFGTHEKKADRFVDTDLFG